MLDLAIKSALAQVDVLPEIWVTDDGSVDNTASVIAKYSNTPNVHYLRADINRGISHNAQWALNCARTEYLVRLDSDDVIFPSYCKRLVNLLNFYPRAGVAHCAVEEIDINGSRRQIRRLARNTGYQSPEASLRAAVFGYKVAANICMFRRSALNMLNNIYDPDLHFCEDWDLFVRLADGDWGNAYDSSILAGYRVWRDKDNLNESRKAAEVFGINFVLEKSITTAWQRRGWNTLPISKARYRFAKHHILSLPIGSSIRDSVELRILLIQLCRGNERYVNSCYSLNAKPFPFLSFLISFLKYLKNLLKSCVYR